MRLDRAQDDTAIRGRRAFTLVELLVVIVIIGLLIAAIGMVGHHVMKSQREKATQNYMRAIVAAIDQFAETNPLRLTYDTKAQRSFGPYPPYIVSRSSASMDVGLALDPIQPSNLAARLFWDLGQRPSSIGISQDNNDDNRALYTYLKVFGGDVLSQVPPRAIAKLPGSNWECVNPSGGGLGQGDPGVVDVLGFYDVWGVPLDYLLFVKLEWKLDYTGTPRWRVTDRTPALRSRGVPSEVAANNGDTADDWIFNTALPAPYAAAVNRETGAMPVVGLARDGGWARAVGVGDVGGGGSGRPLFGFVP